MRKLRVFKSVMACLLVVLHFNNCGQQVSFDGSAPSSKTETGAEAQGAIVDPPVPVDISSPDPVVTPSPEPEPSPVPPPPTPMPPTPPPIVVCDPFSVPGITKPGLKASLYYYDKSDASDKIKTLNDIFTLGKKITDTVIYFSRIYVPTRNFELGFASTDGQLLKNSKGENLIEWFGLKFESNLKLLSTEEDGLYQLGTISDDGSTVEIMKDGSWIKVVDNDGWTSTRMRCGATVSFKAGQKIPMRLNYFQGPRTRIALNLVWRKVTPGMDLNEAPCGGYDFFDSTNGGAPLANFNLAVSKGWKVLSPDNFKLTEPAPNVCENSQPMPPASDP